MITNRIRNGLLISVLVHLAAAATVAPHFASRGGPARAERTSYMPLALMPAAPKPPVAVVEPAPPATPPTTSTATPAPKPGPVTKPVAQPAPIPAAPEPKPQPPTPIVAAQTSPAPAGPVPQATETIAADTAVTSPAPQAVHSHAQQERAKQHYLALLLKRIHKLKHYPRSARRHREHGEVRVSFIIGSSGKISEIRVSHSSGFARLDQAALHTIKRLNPAPPLPAELDIDHWELAVPIVFNLRNAY